MAHDILQALKEYSPDEAKVTRDGHLARIHSSDLVPGDIISIAVGDKIPADCRLVSVSSSSFRVDQAILTGESTSVHKGTEVVSDVKAVKQDMINMLFSVTSFRLLAFHVLTMFTRALPSSMEAERLSSFSQVKKRPSEIFTRPFRLRSLKRHL